MMSREEEQIEAIRAILLQQDRNALRKLEQVLNEQEQLAERVIPIIEEQLTEFQDRFPATYHLAVERIIDRKLADSQEVVLNLMYPVLGKMIRKYVAHQMQEFKDSVDRQMNQGVVGRVRSRFFGKASASDIFMRDAFSSRIDGAYLIEQHSGILVASASRQTTIDKELIAGMLTAIKAFVQDAFKQEDVDLELINYGNYQILIQDLHSYYIALAVSGQLSTQEKLQLQELMHAFTEDIFRDDQSKNKSTQSTFFTEKLKGYFITGEQQSKGKP